ncbi:MAG: SCO family protein [Aquabacterium sp.]|uniref:SCO family protein n=1 Tax=Aquabacterium sp. TaxID=1872578 RepID=UPI00271BE938|nr:SCO family protein [Aquabacterium sp.]MDO9002440.1 SCO family protein [Aquabacterium sp.]
MLLILQTVLAHAQPAALRGLALVDHHGQALIPETLTGRPVLLHFVFTTCASTCPAQVHELAELHAQLPTPVRQRLAMLSVTVDPLSDTPATLKAYARRLGADRPGWRFVTGPPAAVQTLVDRMQALNTRSLPARPSDHRTSLYLFDTQGVLIQRFNGVPVDRPRLLHEIALAARQPRGPLTASSR